MAGKASTWQGRPILDDDHATELETAAGINEFRHKMPREEAEEHAHKDYMKERALDAAAHHLLGVRAAHAAMDEKSARAHGEAYSLVMKAAGHSPTEAPPPEVLSRIEAARPNIYKFKPHAADALFEAPREIPHEDEPDLWAKLDQLKALKTQLNEPPTGAAGAGAPGPAQPTK